MSVFFRQIQHLLPRGRAWRSTIDKGLRKFLVGLAAGAPADARQFADDVYDDLWPETTRELGEWEKQHGIVYPSTDADERIAALAAQWSTTGGQSAAYLQGRLQAAGFDVYVHESMIEREPYDLDTAFYSGFSLDTSATNVGHRGLAWSPDGRYLYVLVDDFPTLAVHQYLVRRTNKEPVSVPKSAAYYTQYGSVFSTLDLTGTVTTPNGLAVSADGAWLYVLDSSDNTVYQWALAAAVEDSVAETSFGFPTAGGLMNGVAIAGDGSKAFLLRSGGIDTVLEYELATPWAIDSGTQTAALSVFTQSQDSVDVAVAKDGSNLAVIDEDDQAVYCYALPTANSVSGAVLASTLDVSNEATTPSCITWGGKGGYGVGYGNGTRLHVGTDEGAVYQYSVADFQRRDPKDYLAASTIGAVTCGNTTATCQGDYPDAPNLQVICSARTTGQQEYLANKDLTTRAQPGLPQNSTRYPFFVYVGGEVFGEAATVSADRQLAFERLLLQLRPLRNWVGLFVNYADGYLLTESGEFLTTENGARLVF